MPEHSHYTDENIVNPETRHEESDVNVRALIWAFVIFVVFAIVTHLLLYAQFHLLARHFRNEASAPLTSMARPSDMSVPASPRLQPFPNKEPNGETLPPTTNTPVTDMEQMRAAEDRALNSAGWVDRQKGIVRLPIETAKQLVIQRGLPVATAAPLPVTGAASASPAPPQTQGEPNAARIPAGAKP